MRQLLDYSAKFIVSRPGLFLLLYDINPTFFRFFDQFWRHVIVWSVHRIQNLGSEDLKDYQLNRLRKTLSHAAQSAPFWQNVFERLGFEPASIESLSELERLPIMKRENIKKIPDSYGSKEKAGAAPFHTSGSTGIPLMFYSDLEAVRSRTAALYHLLKFAGLSAGLKVLRFNILPSRNPFFGIHIWEIGVRDLREKKDRMRLYSFIKRYRPDVFLIWPTPLEHLADFFRQDGFSYSPKAIFACAEHLLASKRTRFENFFGCPIFDVYGSAEIGMMAQDCREKNGFHINPERLILEIVDKNGNPVSRGKTGRILVTFFDNKPMPFIRYDIGDFGYISDELCPCGRKTPRIFFEGKAVGSLILPDGNRIPLIHLIRILDNSYSHWIEKFQYVQKSPRELTLRIVPADRYKDEYDDALKRTILNFLKCRGEINLNIEKVTSIEDLPSGKARVFVSLL